MPTPHEDDVLTLAEAAEVLEVPVEQVQTMIDEGILTPTDPSSGEPKLLRADVVAAGLLGG